MDLPVIGAHCSLPSCNELDLLPIKCFCGRLYCKNHIQPELHACPHATSIFDSKSSDGHGPRQRCSFDSCGKLSLESAISDPSDIANRTSAACSDCGLSFCASHRFPSDHSCHAQNISPAPDKNRAARVLLAKHFSAQEPTEEQNSSADSFSAPLKKNSTALKSKQENIRSMKMRQNARPGDPKYITKTCALSDRFFVEVRVEGNNAYKPYWFHKLVSVGRAFDLLQAQLSLKPNEDWTLLCEVSGKGEMRKITTFSKPIIEELADGSKLTFRRGP